MILETLFHLLIAAIVIGILAWLLQKFAPAPPNPVAYIAWIILFIIALVILLPIVGVHIPTGS